MLGAWTQRIWVFVLGSALGLALGMIDRVAERNATFDEEIDVVLSQIRAEEDRAERAS